MRRLLSVLLFLLPMQLFGQQTYSTARLSDKDGNGQFLYQEKLITVPAPTNAPVCANGIYSMVHPIYYGNTTNPGGTIEVSNAIVDKSQKVGSWSTPAVLTVTSGFQLFAKDYNQPPSKEGIGIIWRVKWTNVVDPFYQVGLWPTLNRPYYYTIQFGGVVPLQYRGSSANSSSPPSGGWLGLANPYHETEPTTGGVHTTVAPAPEVHATNVPQENGTLFYCYMTNSGETAASPTTVVSATKPGSGAVGVINSVSRTARIPQGALGVHIYYNNKRVPAPHCVGTPSTPDDWLWPLDMYIFDIYRLDPNGPAHSPVGNPQSRINALQSAIMDTAGNVVVDRLFEMDLYCPIIDEYDGTGGQKFKRTISTAGAGGWRLTQRKTVPGIAVQQPTFWPGILIHNQYSTWHDLEIFMRWGSAGICTADYSGGQAFGNRFYNVACIMSGWNPATDSDRSPLWLTQGIRTTWGSAGSGHSASEIHCVDCKFNAMVPMWIEHNQSANWIFSRTHGYCGYNDRRACGAWIDTPNQITFDNGIYLECPYNIIFHLGWSPFVYVDRLWVDGGCTTVVEFSNYQAGSISITDAKLNLWSAAGVRPNLVRVVNASQNIPVRFRNVSVQLNSGNSTVEIYSPYWNRMDVFFEDTILSDITVLREPTRAQTIARFNGSFVVPDSWQNSSDPNQRAWWAEWQAFLATPEPGIKFTIPGEVVAPHKINVAINPKTVTVPAHASVVPLKINGSKNTTNIPINVPARNIVVPGETVEIQVAHTTTASRTLLLNSLRGKQKITRIDWTSPVNVVVTP